MPSKSVGEIEQEIYEAVCGVSLPATGLWWYVRALIERLSDRPGHLTRDGRSMPASELARRAGTDASTCALLLSELESSGLLCVSEQGRVIHSPLLTSISKIQRKTAEKVRSHRERRRNKDLQGVTNTRCNPDVTPDVTAPPAPPLSPPLSLSPAPPISIPTPNPTPTPDAAGCAAATRRVRKPKEKPEPKPLPVQRELSDFFKAKWQEKYGREYPFRVLDGVKCAELLRACGGSVEDAKAVITRYLNDEGLFYQGHPLALLTAASQLPKFIAERKPSNGQIQRKPSAAERGEFPEQRRPLPTL